jgi:hypothetical protein
LEYSKREIIIASIASGLLIFLCIVLTVAGFWYLTGLNAEEPGMIAGGTYDPSNEETQEVSDENQRDESENDDSPNAAVSGGYRDSYLFTNPVESLTCVAGILLILVGPIGIDYYMRRRRRRQKDT